MKLDELDRIIEVAIKEDLPQGDITSESIIPSQSTSEAVILAKEGGVLAGIDMAKRVFQKVDSSVVFRKTSKDGQVFRKGDILATVKGNSISLLKAERTALNFLQRMSGIATATRKFVEATKGTKTQILDTRKTTPGLRIIEKYAVRMGGGRNHRSSLSSMVLIKDNHLRLAKSVGEAVKMARKKAGRRFPIEVEVTNFEQAKEAVENKADMVMLDNMPLQKLEEIIRWVKGKVPIEVSGRMSLRKVREVSSLGVDFISIGALTHSFKSVDVSMEFL